jgi:ribonuclease E
MEKAVIGGTVQNVTPETSGEGAPRSGRKRGRRGGQRERERREQAAKLEQTGQAPLGRSSDQPTAPALHAHEQVMPAETMPTLPAETVLDIFANTHAMARETVPSSERHLIVAEAEHVFLPEPVPVPAAEPVAQSPVMAPVAAPAPVPPQMSLPMDDSGLIQIETAPSKRAAVEPQYDATPPVTRRRSRPRDIYSVENSEPLVQIETQHKQGA